ncbi:MAG: hypothetical protein JJU02_03835 [Cryomorphaceae bacterium]|nr:hypothetical protein [Cryomorphaceae bacterium]
MTKHIKKASLLLTVFLLGNTPKPETFTDPRDGKVYQIIKIENREWMAENLAFGPTQGDYWAYADRQSNVKQYGYLYSWETAKAVCPPGWRLPSNAEFVGLTFNLGDPKVVGGKLKSTTGWNAPNTAVNNETGFSGLPGGVRGITGFYDGVGDTGYWWTSSESRGNNGAVFRTLFHNNGTFGRTSGNKNLGLSVRCIKKSVLEKPVNR